MKDWIKLMQEGLAENPDKVPDGYLTTLQMAKELNLTQHGVNFRLRKLMDKGLVDTQEFKVLDKNGRIQVRSHYKILSKKK